MTVGVEDLPVVKGDHVVDIPLREHDLVIVTLDGFGLVRCKERLVKKQSHCHVHDAGPLSVYNLCAVVDTGGVGRVFDFGYC